MAPPKMKQWKKLLLMTMLAWLLLFLSLLSHFLDLRTTTKSQTAHGPSLTRTEVRRLASIQGGPPRGTPTLSLSQGNQGFFHGEQTGVPTFFLEGPHGEILSRESQEVVGWSAVHEGRWERLPAIRDVRQGRKPIARSPEENRKVQRQRRRMRIRLRRAKSRRRAGAIGERAYDPQGDDDYISGSKAVVQRLWKGNASSGMLSPRLQNALKEYLSTNKHRVSYGGQRRARQSSQQVLCELKRKAPLRALDGSEEPFASLGWAKLVPSQPLQQLQGSEFKTCAVVTSAGAMLNSSLGEEIDSHDAVLRFNAATTEGYERDVGNKTTIRIMNSQILARPRHNFNSSSLYQDVTLVAWDPAPYSINLSQWFEDPDYDLFTPYADRRRCRPGQPFYILHPKFIWQLWDVIQANTQESIQPNPPSSGFIGILLMMALCREVHVYEYIPSVRQTDLCHYHEQYYDSACTLGAYHPLLYEKMLIQRLNKGSEQDLKKRGRVTLQGLSTVDCQS